MLKLCTSHLVGTMLSVRLVLRRLVVKDVKSEMDQIANFVYEIGQLSKTPRSGFQFLGSGSQSVAEHLLRTAYIGMALSYLTPEADRSKVILLCLVHDLAEGRTSDPNYVNQKYGRLNEAQAITDMCSSIPFGHEIKMLYEESAAKETLEARLAKEADILEWIASLREQEIIGNIKAKDWLVSAIQRLKTDAGKFLGARLLEVSPDAWWFDKNDPWFVNRTRVET